MKTVFDNFYKRIEEYDPLTNSSINLKNLGNTVVTNCNNEEFIKLLQATIDILWLRWIVAYENSFENVENNVSLISSKSLWIKAIRNAKPYHQYWPTVYDTTMSKIKSNLTEKKISLLLEKIKKKEDFDVMLSLLWEYKYKYSNLGKISSPYYLKAKIARSIQQIIDDIAIKQKKDFFLPIQGTLIRGLSKRSLNFFSYYPEGINLKLSGNLRWIIGDLSLRVFDNATRLTMGLMVKKRDRGVEAYLFSGFEWEPLITLRNNNILLFEQLSPIFQPHLGINIFGGKYIEIANNFYVSPNILWGFYPKISTTFLEFVYLSYGYRIHCEKVNTFSDLRKKTYNAMVEFGIQFSPIIFFQKIR